jgi:ribose transport system substrate-binding protein
LIHDEIRNADSRIIGSTAFMPEKYGQQLLDIALRILNGESIPPAVYIDHVFVDTKNIDLYYPPTA